MLRTALLSLIAVFAFGASASAAMTYVVNIDAVDNSPSNPVVQELQPGTYKIEYTNSDLMPGDALYTAWNAWRNEQVSGCTGGAGCSRGWLYGFGFAYGDTTVTISNAERFATPILAFNAAPLIEPITLTEVTEVRFYINDKPDARADNNAGISLAITAVPEPATWLMMIAGFAVTGMALRRREAATFA